MPFFLSHVPGPLQRWGLAVALAVSALLVPGCARLPVQVDRPVSTALAAPAGTPLAALVQQRRAAAGGRFDSGFLLLDGPQAAYGSRLALVEGAQKTLDLQYYAIHAEASTRRLLGAVREAAARGVRVRILIDDFHSTGRDALVLQLAFEQNIEIRLFNPLAGARGSTLGRLLNSIGDAGRLQQRMHNKLFLADNVLGVTGGRNLGDAYFGIGQSGNFVDLDVLVAGPIVQDLSLSFDAYWNNERAYPVQSLVKREELEAIRAQARAGGDGEPPNAGEAPGPQPPEAGPRPRGGAPDTARREAAWDEKPLDLQAAAFVWAPAAMMVDKPGKIAANPDEGTGATGSAVTPDVAPAPGQASADVPGLVVTRPGDQRVRAGGHAPEGAGRAHVTTINAARRPEHDAARGAGTPSAAARSGPTLLQAAAETAAEGDTVVEGLLQLMGQTRRDLLVISPYFVPGPEIKRAFAQLRQRGVRVRVLTNSLASNDAPIAHVGYARHREELLKMGIELYEMRSEQTERGHTLGSLGGASRAMLHSKVLVVDGRLLVVGSMNLDLRSQLQNTEVALLIGSQTLSHSAIDLIETTLRQGAWHVELAGGRLVWRAPQGSGLNDTFVEPDASIGLKLLLQLLGPLAPDAML